MELETKISNDICVVVQGRTEIEFVKVLKEKFNIPLIFSTWEDADKTAYSETDIVLYNEYPLDRGPHNFQLQRISSLNGFIKAKELGFKRVIKWRCELEPNNSDELLKLFKFECINFHAFVKHQHGYLTDFYMEGNIDDMIELFSIEGNPPYPEFAFTKKFYDLQLNKKVNFILNKLTKDNDILFKHGYAGNYWMTIQQTHEEFTYKLPEPKNPIYN
jgi:hypothetical protein